MFLLDITTFQNATFKLTHERILWVTAIVRKLDSSDIKICDSCVIDLALWMIAPQTWNSAVPSTVLQLALSSAYVHIADFHIFNLEIRT